MERRKTSPSVVPARDDLVARLRARFADIPAEHVRRCVDDLWCCCTHLGVRPEERIIERLAASRLTGVVRGARPPFAGPDGAVRAPRTPLRTPRPPGVRAPASPAVSSAVSSAVTSGATGRARVPVGAPIGM